VSTSSSRARSGKPSRTRNSSSFQEPRRIFTLPARHCELNGPNRVSLSPAIYRPSRGMKLRRRISTRSRSAVSQVASDACHTYRDWYLNGSAHKPHGAASARITPAPTPKRRRP
jgi:hypothetical protein